MSSQELEKVHQTADSILLGMFILHNKFIKKHQGILKTDRYRKKIDLVWGELKYPILTFSAFLFMNQGGKYFEVNKYVVCQMQTVSLQIDHFWYLPYLREVLCIQAPYSRSSLSKNPQWKNTLIVIFYQDKNSFITFIHKYTSSGYFFSFYFVLLNVQIRMPSESVPHAVMALNFNFL